MAKTPKKEEQKGLLRRSPSGLASFEDMERWFDDMFTRKWMRPLRWGFPDFPDITSPFEGRHPKVDVIDRELEIVVRAELPGVTKEDLDVSMAENSLTIRATTSHEKKGEEGEFYRREMSRGEFQRTLAIPDNINEEGVQATFKDGILELKLPKAESSKRRKITVE